MFVPTTNLFSVIQFSKQRKIGRSLDGPCLAEDLCMDRDGVLVNSWLFQISATAAAVIYLGGWRFMLHLRRKQSWDGLWARLTPVSQAPASGKAAAAQDNATNEKLRPSAKLWSVYRNAQTMQEIADYALRNFEIADRTFAEQLHCDATQVRFRAMVALARIAIGRPVKTFA
jgi:hypothetical protein